jgi:arsenate reductase-like glutaredoxin family protein
LAKSVDRVVVGRGKKVVTFDMRKGPPDDDTLAAHLLGPTGNLKAPTLRKGQTLLVGFSEEAYRQVLGA